MSEKMARACCLISSAVATVGLLVGAGECHEGAGLAEAVAGLAVYGKGLLAEVDGCAVCFLGLRRLAQGCQGPGPPPRGTSGPRARDSACSAWARASSYRPAS